MVLEFGLLQSGLFPSSELAGLGVATDKDQSFINTQATGLFHVGVYTGNGFDTSGSGAASSDTDDHVVTFTGAQLLNYSRFFVVLTVYSEANGSLNSASTTVRVEAGEVGGAYSDMLATLETASGTLVNVHNMVSLEMQKALTAGEKQNGLNVRISSVSTWAANCSANVTNKGTTFRAAV